MKGRRKQAVADAAQEPTGGERDGSTLQEVLPEEGDSGNAEESASRRYARAEEQMEAGRFGEAAAIYAAAVAADATDVDALVGLGSALLAQGQYDPAEKELRKALKLAPSVPEVHYQLGFTQYRRGAYAGAATSLRRAVELEPDHAGALVMLGESLNQTGDADGAVEALERAIELQPTNGRAFYALGISYDRKGQPERAAEMYRRSREVGGR